MIHQLNPPIWLETPHGKALAVLVIDYGWDADLLWVTFNQMNGACWTWSNKDVRADKNITLGLNLPKSVKIDSERV